jgi:mono/diheme cytochrome c family protein
MLQTTLKDDVESLVKASPSVVADNPNAQEYLAGRMKLGSPMSAEKKEYGPTRKLSEGDQKLYLLGKEVFHRDAHCATCHQSSGTGVQGVYPPLNVAGNPWLVDEERLVKVVLKGLWGPLEIGGQRFGPTNGVPPMLGFAGMLTDEEAAGVLTYVRQSFGNDFAPVATSAVARVRAATKDRADFYMVEEIMKEHPISGWEKWGRMARPAGDIYE